MKVIVQRSKQSSVIVNDEIVGKIDKGLVLLVGFTAGDDETKLKWMSDKIVNLRIFSDEFGQMNKSLLDVGGSVLSISQFTVYGDARKGRRPSFTNALNPNQATILYDRFNELLKETSVDVQTGVFGADMQVSIHNDGPVTLIVEK